MQEKKRFGDRAEREKPLYNPRAMGGFYGVHCVGCGRPIFLDFFPSLVPDVTMPEGAIRCPYCDDRTIYEKDALVFYRRLTHKARKARAAFTN